MGLIISHSLIMQLHILQETKDIFVLLCIGLDKLYYASCFCYLFVCLPSDYFGYVFKLKTFAMGKPHFTIVEILPYFPTL